MRGLLPVVALSLVSVAGCIADDDDPPRPLPSLDEEMETQVSPYSLAATDCATLSYFPFMEFDRVDPLLPPGFIAADAGPLFGYPNSGRGLAFMTILDCNGAANLESTIRNAVIGVWVEEPAFEAPLPEAEYHIYVVGMATETPSYRDALRAGGWPVRAVNITLDLFNEQATRDSPVVIGTGTAQGEHLELQLLIAAAIPYMDDDPLTGSEWSYRFWHTDRNGTGTIDVSFEGETPVGGLLQCAMDPGSFASEAFGDPDCFGAALEPDAGLRTMAGASGAFRARGIEGMMLHHPDTWVG